MKSLVSVNTTEKKKAGGIFGISSLAVVIVVLAAGAFYARDCDYHDSNQEDNSNQGPYDLEYIISQVSSAADTVSGTVGSGLSAAGEAIGDAVHKFQSWLNTSQDDGGEM